MSADDRFDELGKTLAASTSRRKFLKVAAAAAAGAVLSVVRVPEAAASHNRRCRESGFNCSSNAQCCTHFCDPGFHCACAVVCPGATNGVTTDCCEPGDICCGGQCFSHQETLCSGGQVFNTATCKCENVTVPCGGCKTGEVCCGAGTTSEACCKVSDLTTGQCCPAGSPNPCGRALAQPCNNNNQCCSNRCTGTAGARVCT
jgi:hypothetical protein